MTNEKIDEICSAGTVMPWTMSFLDRDCAMGITPNGLRCQSRQHKDLKGCRATTGVKGIGRFYYEVTVIAEGLCRIGWSTDQASHKLGTDKYGFSFSCAGRKGTNNNFVQYGERYKSMDVIGCMLDTVDWKMSFSKNGVDLGEAFKIDTKIRSRPFYPAVGLKNAELTINFGAKKFKFVPPPGYVGLYNVPDDMKVTNPLAIGGAAGSSKATIRHPNAPLAIIVVPTKIMAEKMCVQFASLKKYWTHQPVKQVLLVSGYTVREQWNRLQQRADIIVSTPERLEDFIVSGDISLTHCRFFVLDEINVLMANYKDICIRIHSQIPKQTYDNHRLQMIACSLALHDSAEVKEMAGLLMQAPTWVYAKENTTNTVQKTVPYVHHVVALLNPMDDLRSFKTRIQTDGVHKSDNIKPDGPKSVTYSEAVKHLRAEYLVQAIKENNMTRYELKCVSDHNPLIPSF